ncbi:hypothetical protein GpSGHVEth099 [Glossina pallidipes salivary gland hypertrophy virus]|uniref:Uncharacterized protein n=2 Tax=Glossina hytrovirus (isolate Glossina pallidipes/Ethiopia/Seibersdorf/-) TaxID=379529 RepID=B0YLP4_GHVS|nr:hypothetical protein SGHV090 [Glossina pallidipes salivary gland hypertrophy virus]ABQ08863.1 hypothetical protein SGHV090 [Glossina pallidipes salivary gland hypertrophy virus]AMB48703.1 hypothetical protein GpSGHVEth099 [Glossina pallidipes salivary gland hypertrophy virus]
MTAVIPINPIKIDLSIQKVFNILSCELPVFMFIFSIFLKNKLFKIKSIFGAIIKCIKGDFSGKLIGKAYLFIKFSFLL